MTNSQYYSIMMMLDILMSFQVKNNKIWTWFWTAAAVLNLVLAVIWTVVGK